jgi:hypothetical protein
MVTECLLDFGNHSSSEVFYMRKKGHQCLELGKVSEYELFICLAMNFARYSIIAPVSSPTGLIHRAGNENPYYKRMRGPIMLEQKPHNVQCQCPSDARHMNILSSLSCTSSRRYCQGLGTASHKVSRSGQEISEEMNTEADDVRTTK